MNISTEHLNLIDSFKQKNLKVKFSSANFYADSVSSMGYIDVGREFAAFDFAQVARLLMRLGKLIKSNENLKLALLVTPLFCDYLRYDSQLLFTTDIIECPSYDYTTAVIYNCHVVVDRFGVIGMPTDNVMAIVSLPEDCSLLNH